MNSLFSSLNAEQPLDAELEQLIEAAIGQLKAGQVADVAQIAAAHPQYIDQLRDLLPTIEMLVRLGDGKNEPATKGSKWPGRRDGISRPEQLGDFRIVREIGRGGMGVVYEAEQLLMGRRVALKVLPFAALAQDKSLQRFRNEVRAAAALDHPHIVSVYSVGEERGVHYYAMQLVRGQSLADLITQLRNHRHGTAPPASGSAGDVPSTTAQQARLTTAIDSRLVSEFFRTAARLGIQAAEALQHAHDQGVLHRDIKPGNLMLDAEGQLYVTDFGLARIETDAGMTMTGDLVGTLRYMAPEQALAKRAVFDHRADVYSLGATLYELLTLQPAFGEVDRSELLKQIAFDEPRPLRKIDRRIPAELETIVLKAMAKQPEERYQTAQQLADDLRAYLEDRPIKAKSPSLLNRSAKWSRRHRGLLAWTAALLVVLTVGSLVSTARLLWEQQRTELAAAESKAVVDFLVNDLLAAPKEERRLDREVTVTEVLANAEAKIAAALADQPLVEARVRQAMAESYQALRKFDKAEPHARRALHLRTELLGPSHHDTLESSSAMAKALVGQGKVADARVLCSNALEVTRHALGPEHPDTLRSMRQMVWVILQQKNINRGDIDDAYQLCQETLQLSQQLLGREHRDTLEAMNYQAILLRQLGQPAQADRICQEILQVSRRILGLDDPFTISMVESFATVLRDRGQLNEAAKLYEEALDGQRRILGNKDPDTQRTMWQLAQANIELGKFDSARKLAEEALVTIREMYGPVHPRTLEAKQLLAFALRGEGKFDKSRELQEEVLSWRRRNWGPADPGTIAAMGDMAYVAQLQGNLDEALERYDETIEFSRRVLGPSSATLLEAMHNRSRVLNKQGKLDEAVEAQEEVLDIRRRTKGPRHPDTLGSMCVLSVFRAKQGKYEESRQLIDEAQQLLPDNEWQVRHQLAWFLATAKWAEIRDGQRALEMATKACQLTGYETATTVDTLAAAYAELGDFETAVKWSEKTLELTTDEGRRKEFAKRLASYRMGQPWRLP